MSLFSSEAFKGNHILVTGATGGIGSAAAKILAGAGADLTLTGRNEKKLDILAAELHRKHEGQQIIAVSGDLTKTHDREQILRQASERIGPVFGLVNNAGVSGGETVDKLSEEDLRHILEVNYVSTVLFTQAVYRQMMKRKEGSIVNVTSLSGLRGTYGNSAYSASKFAMTGFTHSLAVEAARNGIRVNAVAPGYVKTDMAAAAIQRRAKRQNKPYEKLLAEIEAGQPSGRITEPEEVAETIAFLLSDSAGNIVGETVKVSGGSVL